MKNQFTTKCYYHATNNKAFLKILDEGFLNGSGNLGRGVYITESFRIALFYGNILLRVELQPGIKILEMNIPPDNAILKYLRKEFGKDILETGSVQKIIPKNKKLKMSEVIALLRYHWTKTDKLLWSDLSDRTHKTRKKRFKHAQAMHRLGQYLTRFGFSGFGDPVGGNGILIFQAERVIKKELVAVLTDGARQLIEKPNDPKYSHIESQEHLNEICNQAGLIARNHINSMRYRINEKD
jgi:hypothetical protein